MLFGIYLLFLFVFFQPLEPQKAVKDVSHCQRKNLSPAKQLTCNNIQNWDRGSRTVKVPKGRPGKKKKAADGKGKELPLGAPPGTTAPPPSKKGQPKNDETATSVVTPSTPVATTVPSTVATTLSSTVASTTASSTAASTPSSVASTSASSSTSSPTTITTTPSGTTASSTVPSTISTSSGLTTSSSTVSTTTQAPPTSGTSTSSTASQSTSASTGATTPSPTTSATSSSTQSTTESTIATASSATTVATTTLTESTASPSLSTAPSSTSSTTVTTPATTTSTTSASTTTTQGTTALVTTTTQTTTTTTPGYTTAPPPIAQTIYDCLAIDCVCGFIPGGVFNVDHCIMPDGGVYTQALRKEYRVLSDEERSLYRLGFLAVRNTIYNDISTAHSSFYTSPGAHGGPAFLPWHREFLKRLEIGIRTTSVNGTYPYVTVGVPYWDSSMDNDILNSFNQASSSWSPIFSAELMGSVITGDVVDGQFANFVGSRGTVTNRALDEWPGSLTLFNRADLDQVVNTFPINFVMAASAGGSECPVLPYNALEYIHGDPHVWIGGDMIYTGLSTNDPLFFMHHSFVDFIFEQWRQTKQTRAQRETQWNTSPTTCWSDAHQADSTMVPFTNFDNTDGLRNAYTDTMYTYQPRPSCTANLPLCQSRYLFCNTELLRCVARMKVEGPCRWIGGIDPCYESACSATDGTYGTCQPVPSDVPTHPVPLPVPVKDERKIEKCFNQDLCCMFKTAEDCKDPDVANSCPASCKHCTPKSYKVGDDCTDRHPLCTFYKKKGQCGTYPEWMAENCRKECNLCGQTRQKQCKPQETVVSAGANNNPMLVSTCFNKDRCCSIWAKNNGCKQNFMKEVCPASCTCTPIFKLDTCQNFIKQCPLYAAKGLCWLEFMKENCRRSCGSCLSKVEEENC